MKKTFRGKRVYLFANRYPCISQRHPASVGDSYHCPIHRLIVWEHYGSIPVGYHIHHIDEDPWNWDLENLKVISPGEHVLYHNPREELLCGSCGITFEAPASHKRKFCSVKCANVGKKKISWPPLGYLTRRADEIGFKALGRELGVSDNAIRKHTKNHS